MNSIHFRSCQVICKPNTAWMFSFLQVFVSLVSSSLYLPVSEKLVIPFTSPLNIEPNKHEQYPTIQIRYFEQVIPIALPWQCVVDATAPW